MKCLAMNKEVCPCTESCESHGKCCECIRYHVGNGSKTACMRLGHLKN